MVLTDRDRFFRSYITSREGQCFNNRGELIGVINRRDGTAASTQGYLGCVQCVYRSRTRPDHLQDSFLVYDCQELHAATLDVFAGERGSGPTVRVMDSERNLRAVVASDGAISGANGEKLGVADGYSVDDVRVLALFLTLVDPGMLGRRGA